MSRNYFSIFNDVLGPVMTGPSSSHSAGCARIGLTARSLFGGDVRRADIIFEERGSYPSTYIGQGSDFGFTGGLLGFSTDDARLKDAVKIAKNEGREIVFKKDRLLFRHPNEAKIVIYGEDGKAELTLMTYSVGGGMFEITELDGYDVYINGGERLAFAEFGDLSSAGAAEEKLVSLGYKTETASGDNGAMLTVHLRRGEATDAIDALTETDGAVRVRYAEPVMPVLLSGEDAPFRNADEALEYGRTAQKKMWELAVDYEKGVGLVSEEKIWPLVGHIADVMERSTVPPDPEKTETYGFLPYSAEKMKKNSRTVVDAGLLGEAMLAAVSVMENSCAHNIIVASPTAGSSGVVPAAVVTIGKAMGKTDEEIRKALLAAGLVGVFIANQATFGGEVGACQAENGSASAMAAAGLVELLGGSVEEGFRAASMALQNLLGLICDPIAGLTEIPCISRNAAALSNAVMSANMALLGFDPVIPLDETILTMKKVGEQLPAELRCTCGGGLCKTPSGCRLAESIEKKRPKL